MFGNLFSRGSTESSNESIEFTALSHDARIALAKGLVHVEAYNDGVDPVNDLSVDDEDLLRAYMKAFGHQADSQRRSE